MTAPAGYRRPTPPPGPIDPLGEQLFIAVVLVVAGVAGVVWGGAALAFWRAGHGGINTGLGPALEAAVRLPHHFGDPKTAWAEPARAQLPGPVLYWAATLLALSAGAAVGYGGWRFLRPPERVLDRRRRFGVDAQARLARPADLAPLIIRGPVAGRFVLGRLGRHILATENRAVAASRRRARRRQGDVGAVALIGPSRSGKTRTAIAGINAWRGPAILSSVKTDLLAATIANRAARGEVKVFDPRGVTGLDSASWTPLGRAKTIKGAQSAARALINASPRGEHDDSAYWLNQAEILLAGLLWLAANTEGRTIADIVDWILGQDRPTDQTSGTVAPLVRAVADGGDPSSRVQPARSTPGCGASGKWTPAPAPPSTPPPAPPSGRGSSSMRRTGGGPSLPELRAGRPCLRGLAVGRHHRDAPGRGARPALDRPRARGRPGFSGADADRRQPEGPGIRAQDCERPAHHRFDPVTVTALRAHRARQVEERLALGPGWEEHGLIFTWYDGRPIHPERFSKWFEVRAIRSGLPRIRLHDLRHSYATAALAANVSPKVVSERLGHAKVGITLDVYSHVLPSMDEQAALTVARLILGDEP